MGRASLPVSALRRRNPFNLGLDIDLLGTVALLCASRHVTSEVLKSYNIGTVLFSSIFFAFVRF